MGHRVKIAVSSSNAAFTWVSILLAASNRGARTADDLYSYNASSDIDDLYDLRDPDPVNLSGRPEHAAARKHMIERLGAVLARDPRWLAYWSSFQVDHYFDLPRSLPGDLQLRVF